MKKLVMIDLDGVVLDGSYKTNKQINKTVQKAAKNCILVPNSDTPITRLRKIFFESVGFKADVLIGENGALVQYGNSLIYAKKISGIKEYLQDIEIELSEAGFEVVVCDSLEMIKRGMWPENNELIVLVDNLRLQSISLFFRERREGIMSINQEFSQECLKRIYTVRMPDGLEKFIYNPKYGIAISSIGGVNKTDGFILLKAWYPGYEFYMIGDSDADLIDNREVSHLSVANGSIGLKKRSRFVSRFQYTEGLEECLDMILSNKI